MEKVINSNKRDQSLRLNDFLWVYRTSYGTPFGMFPYRIIYAKACHLPLELEHKAYWGIKHLNMDMNAATEQKKLQLYELEELWLFFYENARLYRETIK